MKFGQLIGYNMRNIFLEKSYTNIVEKLIKNWAYLWNNKSEVLHSFVQYTAFNACQAEDYPHILKFSRRPFAFTS